MAKRFPNYILRYYQQIKDGRIVVGSWIEMWYDYVINGLKTKKFYYNSKKANASILFIENFCRHHEGELAPNKIELELWQKSLLSVVYGIVDKSGNRQFREIFLVVARKNGKTLLAGAMSNYNAYLDGEQGARIYYAAPKLDQARLCFDAVFQMIQKEPLLSKMTQKRRTDLYIPESNTTLKPLAFNAKKSDGLNISMCVADEVASWGGDAGLKFYEVIKSSQGARKQPMILAPSTAGYIDGGVYDELFARATRLLKGDSKETRFAPFIYQIDDIKKWNDIEELQKSNPNLNVSVSVQYLLDEIAIAEGSISKKAEFLTKYCNIKQNSAQAWLRAEDIARCCSDEIKLEDYKKHYAVVGIDLSRTTDLTCAMVMIQKQDKLNIIAQFFMPKEKVQELSAADNLPYQIYIQKGWLKESGENFVDYKDVEEWVCNLLRKYQIYPLVVGYDRYSSQYLIHDLESAKFKVDDVTQGYNLTPVIQEFEGLVKDGRVNIGNNELLKIHFLNAALKIESETDRKKLIKISQTEHIDGMAATLDAVCVRQKWWNEYASYLINERK